MESGNNGNDLRTTSFAVYLRPPADDSLVKKLGRPRPSWYAACFRENKMHLPLGSVKITTGGRGNGIFGSEKLFNRKIEDYHPRRLVDDCASKKEEGLGCCWSVGSSVTTSARCESGWNIRSALWRGFKKKPVRGGIGFVGSGFFRQVGCNKSCSDENSIPVREENSPKHKPQQHVLSGSRDQTGEGIRCTRFRRTSSTGSRREDIFAFPVQGNVPHRQSSERPSLEEVVMKEDDEDPRHSIEVFGSGHEDKKKGDAVTLNLERKLSILTWDAIPKPQYHKGSPGSSILNYDQESEASSDLFEIENISETAA